MKRSLKIYFLPAILLLVVGTVLGMRLESASSSDNTLEQLKKLEHAFVTINRQYVEDVEAEVIAEKGIEAMLKQLDPHSTYISAKEIKEIQEGYQGSFGGIGIWFEIPRNDDNLADDTARVVSIISGGPSEEVGLQPGDPVGALVPLSSVAAFCFGMHLPAMLGSPMVCLEKWDPATAVALLREHITRPGAGRPGDRGRRPALLPADGALPRAHPVRHGEGRGGARGRGATRRYRRPSPPPRRARAASRRTAGRR